MSLNSIQLKPQLLATLYHESLVQEATTSVPEKKLHKYLGNNAKQILILVSHASLPFLPDQELNFLTSILTACKLSLADIAIINLDKTDDNQLQQTIASEGRIVLLFGIEPSGIGLPIHFPVFQVQQFNHTTYMHAPTLTELETDRDLKSKLWNSLKNLFGL
jgi:hypothetical protein